MQHYSAIKAFNSAYADWVFLGLSAMLGLHAHERCNTYFSFHAPTGTEYFYLDQVYFKMGSNKTVLISTKLVTEPSKPMVSGSELQ